MGFYTTWRLLSWNEYSIVLGLFTKRPKNLFFTLGTVLDVKLKNRLDLIDRQNLCIGNINDPCRRTIKHVLMEFEGTWMILTMPITFGLKTFNREGKQDI